MEIKLNISKRIISIVAETFEIPLEDVSLDTAPSNTSAWDSFGQMNLVLNIEKEFGITLEFDEIFRILSTRTLLEVVEEKLNEDRK